MALKIEWKSLPCPTTSSRICFVPPLVISYHSTPGSCNFPATLIFLLLLELSSVSPQCLGTCSLLLQTSQFFTWLLAFSSQPKGHFLRDVFPDLSFCFLQFFFSWTCFIFIMLFISKLNYDNYLLFFVCLFLHSLLTCLLPERKGLVCLRVHLYCKNSAWLELAFNKIGMNDLSVF